MALVDYGGADVSEVGDWGYSALHFYARQKQEKDEYDDPDKVDHLREKLKKLAGKGRNANLGRACTGLWLCVQDVAKEVVKNSSSQICWAPIQ